MSKTLPTCQKCQYYKVTWDEHKPHGCSFFSFKSYHLPAVEVQLSTGMICPKFRLSAKHGFAPAQFSAQQLAKPLLQNAPQYSKDGELLGLPEENLETSALEVLENENEKQAKGSVALGQILGEKGILR